MMEPIHQFAPHSLPAFVTRPGETDYLFVVVVVSVVVLMLLLGSFYLWLHSLPERLAHGAQRTQFQIVAVLGLIALFTHNNIFWVAALLLALVQLPNFGDSLSSMATSLNRLANREGGGDGPTPATEPSDTLSGEQRNA